ncbi:MAG: Secreted protein [Leifsonia sp.]|nr:Secreted protein [Leifsonia sp.]
MTLTDQGPVTTPIATTPTVTTPTVRRVARRGLFWLILTVIALVFAVVATLAVGGGSGGGVELGASNPAPLGAQAVVEVLRQQGVTVTEASTIGEARRAAGPGSSILVYDPSGYLDSARLGELRGIAGTMVLVDPSFAELTALTPGVRAAGTAQAKGTLSANCSLPAAIKAGSISSPRKAYRVTGAGPTGCFPADSNAFALVTSTSAGSTVHVLGSTDVLSNEGITRAGNAALALNLLGEHPTLVWYLPTLADVAVTGPPSLAELTPGWVTPVMLLLLVVAFAAAIWRGRRFGPLVVEKLPVVVRAGETMEGRARLYQRSSSRLRAIDGLRIGAVTRLAAHAGLPRTASVTDVVDTVAALTGRDRSNVRGILLDAVPHSDADLVWLSDQLLDLETATARAVRPGSSRQTGRMNP